MADGWPTAACAGRPTSRSPNSLPVLPLPQGAKMSWMLFWCWKFCCLYWRSTMPPTFTACVFSTLVKLSVTRSEPVVGEDVVDVLGHPHAAAPGAAKFIDEVRDDTRSSPKGFSKLVPWSAC